jgi:hypothetical protein
MSLEGTVAALIAARRLHEYRHSNPDAHTIKDRRILYANPVASWLTFRSPQVATSAVRPTKRMIATLRAKLDAILSEPGIPVCEVYGRGAGPCVLKRLRTGLAHEVWEVRADPPDFVRAYGFFVGLAQLFLTHASRHPDGSDEWEQQIRFVHHVRVKLEMPPEIAFRRASIHDYI